MLIVGTGEHAEETLSGLDFLDVECVRINEPAENVSESDGGGSLEQLTLAELKDSAGRYNTDKDSMIMVSSWGDGAVELVPYALSDLGDPDQVINGWDSYVWELLHNANNYVKNLIIIAVTMIWIISSEVSSEALETAAAVSTLVC